MQMTALFDVPPAENSTVEWDVALPVDEKPWSIGLIVGASGSGKTTVARELFGDRIVDRHEWPGDRSILDAFPKSMGIKDITGALTAVGFGSAPNWMRPFHVLSNGEQFRVTVARALAEAGKELVVIDEFTSVIDRAVAKVASHSVQKAVRRNGGQLVAVACHYDIIEWLQPDWVFEPHTNSFEWRCLRRRPQLDIEVRSASKEIWPLFSKYHYLSANLHTAAKCVAAFYQDRPIAFSSVRYFPHPHAKDIMMGHRLVVLPDFQGLGLGGILDDWLGQWLWERGWRYHNVVAHPAMIASYSRSPRWRMQTSGIRTTGGKRGIASMKKHQAQFSAQRNSVTFAYTAPAGSESKPRLKKALEL
ncbi:hypothetical protein GCM10007036_14180 [Alsobacter metallidurans]|uniref:N-acetyltransferase domain-containing protein n=2 Tax=Alsobacter metallidurans TaxID=340221 RepID=A0A917I4W1_9HYPH|nr:hypothetical protein GCM10007036_14180 [Alsobacter metallidurans]